MTFCAAGETCVAIDPVTQWGRCAQICATDQTCPPTAACRLDVAGGHCIFVFSSAATTFDAGNGAWLASAINDIDGDGRPNHEDNCPGVSHDVGTLQTAINPAGELQPRRRAGSTG